MKIATKQFHILLNGKGQNNAKKFVPAIYDFIKKNELQTSSVFGNKKDIEAIEDTIKAIPQINFFVAVNHLVKQNNRLLKKIQVSEDEVVQFYKNYKWAFSKNSIPNSEHYKIDEVKKDIITKIKRLKYYGLGELLTKPPKVKIIWEKKQTSGKRGLLDTPSPEEFAMILSERQKTSASLAFSHQELVKLFNELNYASISDLYERALLRTVVPLLAIAVLVNIFEPVARV